MSIGIWGWLAIINGDGEWGWQQPTGELGAKLDGMVWGLALSLHSSAELGNSHNGYGHDDSTINIITVITVQIHTRYSHYTGQYMSVGTARILLQKNLTALMLLLTATSSNGVTYTISVSYIYHTYYYYITIS